MRISYSCMANLERLIKSHNQRILNKSNSIKNQCNCAGGCKYNLRGAIAGQRTLFIRQQLTLTLKRSSTSAYAPLNSDFGMPTIKNPLKVVYTKMKLSFRSMFAALSAKTLILN